MSLNVIASLQIARAPTTQQLGGLVVAKSLHHQESVLHSLGRHHRAAIPLPTAVAAPAPVLFAPCCSAFHLFYVAELLPHPPPTPTSRRPLTSQHTSSTPPATRDPPPALSHLKAADTSSCSPSSSGCTCAFLSCLGTGSGPRPQRSIRMQSIPIARGSVAPPAPEGLLAVALPPPAPGTRCDGTLSPAGKEPTYTPASGFAASVAYPWPPSCSITAGGPSRLRSWPQPSLPSNSS